MDGLKLVPKSNRKPADELADIREQIRELGARESELRAKMIAGECSLVGDEFDVARIRKELGTQFLRPFLKRVDVVCVKLKER